MLSADAQQAIDTIVARFARLKASELERLAAAVPGDDGGIGQPGDSAWWTAKSVGWGAAVAAGRMPGCVTAWGRVEAGLLGAGNAEAAASFDPLNALDAVEMAILAAAVADLIDAAHLEQLRAPWAVIAGQADA